MDNKTVARTLRLMSQLMELHDENSFKIRSVANAAFKIDKLPYSIAEKSLAELEQIDGIGKSMASRIESLITTGLIPELQAYLADTPAGIVEMMQLKGLGPKKIKVIWQDLGIENMGELYYACNENRLIEAKGFGLKTQDEVIRMIDFKMASSGRFLYARIEDGALYLLNKLKEFFGADLVFAVGQFRRKCEIIDSLDFLIVGKADVWPADILNDMGLTMTEVNGSQIHCESETGVKVNLNFVLLEDLGWQYILQTGSESHVAELKTLLKDRVLSGLTESEIYELAGLSFIEPELREGTNEFSLAKSKKLPVLIEYTDLKGTLHNHSTWSDGVHSLEELALYCRDELKLEYLGISDHSKSAFYANGLNEVRIAAQHREIDELNLRLQPFEIFKGIESDILYDGSLDYSDDVLATFDFVVASIHTTFKMSEDKATERLIRAIENPYTTILGHPTGRLLLSRNGYPINHKNIIDACAANGVVIEINSNPLRLDMDWRWHQYAIEKGVILSINPDAHRKEGFRDMYYGTQIARKGGVSRADCLNALSLQEIKARLKERKSKRIGK